MPRLHVVFGNYKTELDVKPGERVVFIGDCAEYHGKIGDQTVSIENLYKKRSTLDPYTAQSDDIFVKSFKIMNMLRKSKDQQHLRLTGCPVSVAEQVLTLVNLAGTSDPTREFSGVASYAKWKAVMAGKALMGHKYQVHGAARRGEAAPEGMVPVANAGSNAAAE
jgi:hypothetical protein